MKKLLILVTIMAFSPLAFSKGHSGHSKRGFMKIFKQLDLTEEQKTQIKFIRESNKDKNQFLREQAKTDKKAFKEALNSVASNSKLKSLRKKMMKSKKAMKDEQFDTMLSIRDILTQEQRTKFHELKSQMKGKRHSNYFE